MQSKISSTSISRFRLFVDSLVIFINLSASYSIIPYLAFHQYHRFINSIFLVLINLLYVSIRFRKVYKINNEPLLILFVSITFINLIAAYITDTGWYAALAYLVLNTVFYYTLYNIYMYYTKIMYPDDIFKNLVRGYIWLVVLAMISSILLFCLGKVGLNLHSNPVNTTYDLYKTNYEELGSYYYFPYYLGIVVDSLDIRIPFFQNQGVACGLYHESHIMTFMIFPCFPLMWYYTKNKWLHSAIIVGYFLILLLAGSTTNILSVVGCIVVCLLYRFKKQALSSLILVCFIVLMIIVLLSTIDLTIFQFIFDKMNSTSVGYSQTTMEFAVSPHDIIGTSIFDESEVTSQGNIGKRDVGYIICILNIIFLLLCIKYMIRLFKSESKIKLAFLIFSCYFFFHSTKVSMVSYSLTMLIFVVFCIGHLSRIPDKAFEK